MIVNIDDYYLVLISQITEIVKDNNKKRVYYSPQKYTIVKQNKYIETIYEDLFSNETYKIMFKKYKKEGTLFIDIRQDIIPVRNILNTNSRYMLKSRFIKHIRQQVIDINYNHLKGYKDAENKKIK